MAQNTSYQSDEDMRDGIRDSYANARGWATLGTHVGAALLTTALLGGPWSLVFTGMVAFRAGAESLSSSTTFRPNDFVSGYELAFNLAEEKFIDAEKPKSSALAQGIKDGVVGTVLQPLAWAVLTISGVWDMIGHGLRGADVGIAAMTGADDAVIERKRHKVAFGATNTLSDDFWRMAAIMPSKNNARDIMENSTRPVDEELNTQRWNAQRRVFK